MKTRWKNMILALIVLSLTFSCVESVPAFAATVDTGVLNPQNYKLYGNGDEYCTYNQDTASLDVMAHTAYKTGFKINTGTELNMELSINSVFGKWLGVGFLGGANYGAPASPDNGVMLYVTADESNTYYVFRIFRMNPITEGNSFVTNIPVNTKFRLSLKYDSAEGNWYYYANGTKVDTGQAYFRDEPFIVGGCTYLNFAYENDENNTPIKIYSFKSKYITDDGIVVPTDFQTNSDVLDSSNYTLYGGGDEYCYYDFGAGCLKVMAHTAYKNGFKLDDTTQLMVELSANSVSGKWLGLGFLNGAKYGEPSTTNDGVMLYVTADEESRYYVFRIFQMNPLVEKKEYRTSIPVGTKFRLSLKRDEDSNNWFYYINGQRVDTGEAYFEGENITDRNGYTYLNFAYENYQNVPIQVYSFSYGKPDTENYTDANGDGSIDIRDLVRIKKIISDVGIYEIADVNRDGVLNLSDIMALRKILLQGSIYKDGLTIVRDSVKKLHDTNIDTSLFTGKVYYVSNNGNDSANGLTPDTAFKTIGRVNQLNLTAGDAVLFASGGVYDDACLQIKNSGTVNKHITVSYYGTGAYPIVRGGVDNDEQYSLSKDSTATASIKISSAFNVTVRGLHLDGANFGIFLNNTQNVSLTNSQLNIDDCIFTNITGYYCLTLEDQNDPAFTGIPPFYSNAIQIGLRGQMPLSSVSVTNSTFTDCDAAMHLDTVTKVTMNQVEINNMYREGILFETCKSQPGDPSMVTNVTIRNVGTVYGKDWGTAAIQWNCSTNFTCDNLDISYTGNAEFKNDMLGGDFEASNRNITVQNSYIHNNGGEGWLIYRTPGWGLDNTNVSFINNVFQNNGLKDESTAAFLRYQYNENTGGNMTNNTIYLTYPGQKLNYIDGINTNAYPGKFDYTGTVVYNPKPKNSAQSLRTIYSFDFDGAYDYQQWNGTRNVKYSYMNGMYLTTLLQKTEIGDTQLLSDNHLNLNLKEAKWFQIKLKNKTRAESMRVYFANQYGNFSEEFITIPIQSLSDEFVEYTISLDKIISFGTVRQIKILPAIGADEGWLQYDYIRFIG